MAKSQHITGRLMGATLALSVLILGIASVLTGDVRLRMAGLDVRIQNQTNTGLIVLIDGDDCPGKSCPAFAVDWKLARQG